MTITMDMKKQHGIEKAKEDDETYDWSDKKNNKDLELMQQLKKDDKIVADLLLDVASVNKSFTISYNRLSVIS